MAMADDLPARLAAKLEEVQTFADGLNGLLLEAALAGLTRPSTAPELTRRDRDILGLLANGCTNAEMAARLNLSEHTIKDHCSALYRRLGVRNRVSAVTRAHDLGLV